MAYGERAVEGVSSELHVDWEYSKALLMGYVVMLLKKTEKGYLDVSVLKMRMARDVADAIGAAEEVDGVALSRGHLSLASSEGKALPLDADIGTIAVEAVAENVGEERRGSMEVVDSHGKAGDDATRAEVCRVSHAVYARYGEV